MGYGEPPWEFKGRALYQLSLVRVEEARKYVPPELPLVNFLGWTLGGFYLARYSSSPVGAFDEMVALGGLAWNFPTSCAWAARVYVNDRVARDHGISSVGLPSRLAAFKALPLPPLEGGSSKQQQQRWQQQQQRRQQKGSSWWDLSHRRSSSSSSGDTDSSGSREAGSGSSGSGSSSSSGSSSGSGSTATLELFNAEPAAAGSSGSGGLWRLLPGAAGRQRRRRQQRGLSSAVCSIEMPQLAPAWAPKIQMFLPSFSGATPDVPGLFKYSLKLTANIRPMRPARVAFPAQRPEGDRGSPEVLDAVLGGRPLLCLAFDNMHMEVQPPEAWHPQGAPQAAPAPAAMPAAAPPATAAAASSGMRPAAA